MNKPNIKIGQPVLPMIYAYSTPDIPKYAKYLKIGYTEQNVDDRINQQGSQMNITKIKQWAGNAIFEDGSGYFTDHQFHRYLIKKGVEKEYKTEWFEIDSKTSKGYFYEFRENKGISDSKAVMQYYLRKEQIEAVEQTYNCYMKNKDNKKPFDFLWNAKPRFGKTLSVYDLCCNKLKLQNILIVTNRPAIANSWYSDYENFIGTSNGYYFISNVEGIANKELVVSREEFDNISEKKTPKCIEFVSLQDLKTSQYFGGEHDKLKKVTLREWDILVIDEAHEGVDTYKTDVAFERIHRKFTLHLSGTPFKALQNEKFEKNAIYNWTYADEQKAKNEWKDESSDDMTNPYLNLPKLNLFTYQMSKLINEKVELGMELDGNTVEYCFDLNEFFKVKNGEFEHEEAVDKFLDTLTTNEKYPFSTQELRDELKHTFWLLDRVDSVKALAKKLKNHDIFGNNNYEIIIAAGDGKSDDEEEITEKQLKNSYNKVVNAIQKAGVDGKTITLSVGQLTTGVTIPEWSAVLMLSNVKSPSLYMQSAFRSQNPCLYKTKDGVYRKKNAYVFDFDPARTLDIVDRFANDLCGETSYNKGDISKRKNNIRTLLNFLPVIGEDEEGKMIELDAEKVLSIPRKIRSVEVVKRGFMSNYLFQNISGIFNAPQEIVDTINKLVPAIESKRKETNVDVSNAPKVDNDGNIILYKDIIKGTSAEMFGDKIYDIEINAKKVINDAIETTKTKNFKENEDLENLKKQYCSTVGNPMVEIATEKYGDNLSKYDKSKIQRKIQNKADLVVGKAYGDYNINLNIAQKEYEEKLKNTNNENEKKNIEKTYEQTKNELRNNLKEEISTSINEFVKEAGEMIVETVEKSTQEKTKKTIEEGIREHLRGFSRTIPSFLMAYGDDNVTLSVFDTIIPDDVFKDVTSISLEDFRKLRDGFDYTDEETGEIKHFDGNVFDNVVFDDSIKEFLRLKQKLSNYFDESVIEDIFDYIPPQKTNQIFTPKIVVKKMVDMLEENNPNCFDDADATFIDMYMKSGLYIAEIVKRLYQSNTMKKKFPDSKKRLKHIFKNQVYGLAPTDIIYNIAKNFVLGFDEVANILDESDQTENRIFNLVKFDAQPHTIDGTLQEKLDKLFDK